MTISLHPECAERIKIGYISIKCIQMYGLTTRMGGHNQQHMLTWSSFNWYAAHRTCVFINFSGFRPVRWLQPLLLTTFEERRSHGFCWEKWDPEAHLLLGCVWFTTFIGIQPTFPKVTPNKGLLLVGGLEHECYFPFHIWDVILPIDELIFFKMVKTC